MARGNTRRRALINELGLAGQAESISTKQLLVMKDERATVSKRTRRSKSST